MSELHKIVEGAFCSVEQLSIQHEGRKEFDCLVKGAVNEIIEAVKREINGLSAVDASYTIQMATENETSQVEVKIKLIDRQKTNEMLNKMKE